MKPYFLALLLSVSLCAGAQAGTSLKISYLIRERDYVEQQVPFENNYELIISGDSSCFQMEIDPSWGAIYLVPEQYSILKNFKTSELLYREGISTLKYCYSETIPEYEWQLMEQDTIVCGYSCQKAKTYYKGRVWYAWYSSDLPYDNGPWKLGGLPGLILKAYDSKGDFFYEAYKVKNYKNIKIQFDANGYIKTTRKKFLEDLVSYYNDTDGFDESHGLKTYEQKNEKVQKSPSKNPCLEEEIDDGE